MATILIIEDNQSNMNLMKFLLTKFGHTCIGANDGMTGIDLARKEMPDLILCDIQLPRMDGYGIVRVLKGSDDLSHIPVLAVSSFAMHGDEEKALAGGFDAYITKPIEPKTFVGEIEALLTPKEDS